jgi:5-methyltetrahydrofolate--homocysteine methyltransferase
VADNKLELLKDAVIDGQHLETVALTKQLLEAKANPKTILDDGLIAGMAEVGELFKEGEFFVPEMLIAARAMQSALAVLRPILVDTGVEPIGTVVLGTVQGDLHDIGKNLTGMFLEGAGFKVVDLGVDVSADQFIEAIREHKAHILGMSSLLTTTMTYTAQVMKKLEEENLRDQVKVIVGGAPITQDWANHIGADTFALDAASAAEKCKEIIGVVH